MRRLLLLLLLVAVGLGVGLFALVAVLGTPAGPPPADAPGYLRHEIQVAHRAQPVPVGIWYPAADDAPAEWRGRSALFHGHGVRAGATARDGRYPIALLSHGSGGTGARMGWLAVSLAQAGWIVVAPDHPGTRSRDSVPEATVRVWERTEDFAALLDALPGLMPPGTASDGRIAVLGFSLGGHTALALGGARLSKDAFVAECARRDDYDCGWLRRGGVDLTAIDAERYEADLSDRRIGAIAAIDPALSAAMTAGSLGDMAVPVLVVNLGEAPPEAMRARSVAADIPGATYQTIQGASHFAMLARCSDLGRLVLGLAARADEDICARDPRPRAEIQAEVAALVATFLEDRTRPR